MIRIHDKILGVDIPRSLKKRWYPDLDIELKRILKLLNVDGKLPGQYPMRGFRDFIIQHARINLPKNNSGKSDGPRIVFYIKDNGDSNLHPCNVSMLNILVLYVGGHKDKKYNDDDKIVNEVVLRLADFDDNCCTYDDYLKSVI